MTNIVQDFTLHTHTMGFDGMDSVQTMVDVARKSGFRTIGISNHFIVYPGISESAFYPYAVRGGYRNIYSNTFDEAIDRFEKHYEEIEKARVENPDMKILRGMEVDFFNKPEWYSGFSIAMKLLKPDYLIGSAHFIEYGGQLTNTHDWKHADSLACDVLMAKYWTNVKDAAKTGLFDFMAHLDLPKKVGLGCEEKWAEYEHRAIDAISDADIAIELNMSFDDGTSAVYPSDRILRLAKQNDVPVLLSDDAHKQENIGRRFNLGEQIIRNYNLKRYAR